MNTAEPYEEFARLEAATESPTYAALALAVAGDADLLAKLEALPPVKRQPNLLFGAVRYLGGPTDTPKRFTAWTREHWATVSATMASRLTQTNEPGRQATLLPLLARIEGPVAMLEVGASAGLCLYPDRWSYDFSGTRVGDPSLPVLPCAIDGDVPIPTSVPDVVWRAGLDLKPLDVANDDDMRWLECLVWPEHDHRRLRLKTAIDIARQDPPYLVAGDLGSTLTALVSEAPRDATLVVFHSAVLAYVSPEKREAFVSTVHDLPGHWISNEGPTVLPRMVQPPTPKPQAAAFLMAWDGRAGGMGGAARSEPHMVVTSGSGDAGEVRPGVQLAESDPKWPAMAAAEAERIALALAPWLTHPIEHIGSTSVPGLLAKPQLDLMAGVADLAGAADAVLPLQDLGYVHGPHRADALWFHGPAKALHLTVPGSALWVERLAFRDALRTAPALLAEYAALKLSLTANDLPAYTAGKRAFVTRVLAGEGVTLPAVNATVPEAERVRAALIGQWQVLALAAPPLDLAARTRLTGWRNAELLAHLAAQPAMLEHFLDQADPGTADLDVARNIAGTRALAAGIDLAAKEAAATGRSDLPAAVAHAIPLLLAADPDRRLTSLRGTITLTDYLRTRCVEAVVHGLDAVPQVLPEPAALTVAADALLGLLERKAPHLRPEADAMPGIAWVECATGRTAPPAAFAQTLPLMT